MRAATLYPLAIAFALGACGTSSERGKVVRGATKADGSNSCKDRCGGQAPAGCYCDDACALHGDCCTDKGTYCDDAPGSCQGSCGGQAPAGCWCDAACAQHGDCCGDKEQLCGASCASAQDCGACLAIAGCNWTADQCSEHCAQDTYCYGPENPAAPTCPADPCLDVMCALYCEFGYEEGPDGCMICKCKDGPGGECFGAWLDETGTCRNPADGGYPAHCCEGAFCGGIAGILCPEGYQCALDGSYPDAGGKCVPECSPVMCEIFCPYGFEKDANGCSVCQCAQPLQAGAACSQADDRCGDGLRCCQTCCGTQPPEGEPIPDQFTCVTDPGDGSPCPLPM